MIDYSEKEERKQNKLAGFKDKINILDEEQKRNCQVV